MSGPRSIGCLRAISRRVDRDEGCLFGGDVPTVSMLSASVDELVGKGGVGGRDDGVERGEWSVSLDGKSPSTKDFINRIAQLLALSPHAQLTNLESIEWIIFRIWSRSICLCKALDGMRKRTSRQTSLRKIRHGIYTINPNSRSIRRGHVEVKLRKLTSTCWVLPH